jgi:hypothetical protein
METYDVLELAPDPPGWHHEIEEWEQPTARSSSASRRTSRPGWARPATSSRRRCATTSSPRRRPGARPARRPLRHRAARRGSSSRRSTRTRRSRSTSRSARSSPSPRPLARPQPAGRGLQLEDGLMGRIRSFLSMMFSRSRGGSGTSAAVPSNWSARSASRWSRARSRRRPLVRPELPGGAAGAVGAARPARRSRPRAPAPAAAAEAERLLHRADPLDGDDDDWNVNGDGYWIVIPDRAGSPASCGGCPRG